MRVHGYSEQNHASSPLFCPLPSRPLRPGPARPTAPRPWPVVGAVARSRGAPPPPAAGAEREREGSESQNSRQMLSLHNLQLAAAVVDDEVRVKRRFMRIG